MRCAFGRSALPPQLLPALLGAAGLLACEPPPPDVFPTPRDPTPTATPGTPTVAPVRTPTPVPTPTVGVVHTPTESGKTPTAAEDGDGDGFTADVDCDDTSDEVYPGAVETCGDGIDQGCAGVSGDCALTGDLYPADAVTTVTTDTVQAFVAPAPMSAVGDHDLDGFDDLLLANVAFSTQARLWFGGDPPASQDFFALSALVEGAFDSRPGQAAAHLDFNGDGDLDLVLGVPGQDLSGSAWMCYAGTLGAGTTLRLQQSPPAGCVRFSAPAGQGWELGAALAADLDLDGDGCHELAVGGPDRGGQGSVLVWSGRGPGCRAGFTTAVDAQALDASSAEGRIDGAGRFGRGVAAVRRAGGDLLVVGAPDTDAGEVYVFSGPAEALGDTAAEAALVLTGESDGDLAGLSVASAGDLDGDGVGDLLVGAPGFVGCPATGGTCTARIGAVYLVGGAVLTGLIEEGEASAALVDVGRRIDGALVDGWLGDGLGPAGDVDGDGRADLLLGGSAELANPGCPPATAGWLTYGPLDLFGGLSDRVDTVADVTFTSEVNDCQKVGAPRVGGFDFDGDGYGDVLVGATFLAEGDGAYLYLGRGL